ncbi:MAG: SRPBCC family protein [Actinomycetia bacterium]|nr:SRPBCC family protein [Actinomycetes bacterium]
MDITEQFTVTRPVASVWDLFLDVPQLSRCLPGAELIKDHGDGTYDGKVTVKLGPITAAFDGSATVTTDAAARSLQIKGRGVDKAGGSQGRVDVNVRLSEPDEVRTEVHIDAKVMLAGPIAQFGRTGLVNEVSRRLIEEFSTCIHAKLDAETEEAAARIEAADVKGVSLFLASTWATFSRWLKGIFSRD